MTDEDVLAHAHRLARAYLDGVSERHVGGSDPVALRRPLTDSGEDAVDVLKQLAADADPGLVASAGPRYFGFVVGGTFPVALGADWLVSAWDQMCGMYSASPAVAVAEEVATGWILELLGLPPSASVGFVTGAQMANFTCLAAARGELLRRAGWDADAQGLFGAPPIEVLVGEEVHVTVLRALGYLGLGHNRVTRVGVDANGAMDPLALEGALLAAKGPVLLCAQAGNVNTGACDPLGAIGNLAAEHGAWLHVDGAFGLWAAASPRFEGLVAGRDRADSWAVDAHKWLNVPYDCAFAIVAPPEALLRAMALSAVSLARSGHREPTEFVPEASRRGRAIPVYAALRYLGRRGVAELIERCCGHATLMASLLQEGGLEVLNDVVLKEIANHLNRPGGPPSPKHVDSKRNTAGKWSKTTIRAILENPVYTGRLYWNRLDFRQTKLGEGPLIRRPEEEWIQAERRHEAIISDDWFQQAQEQLTNRPKTEGSRRRSPQRRTYALRGIVHCATGHNPLRMHGKERKGITYYACCYRIAYGDKAAEALGHGKWQYVREDVLLPAIDRFFATNIFGAQRIHHLRAQHADLGQSIATEDTQENERLREQIADIEHRIDMQVRAIEAGVEPALVSARIDTLKHEQQDLQRALATSERSTAARPHTDLDSACEILDQLPILENEFAAADPELRRQILDAFKFSLEVDRNKPEIRLRALVSSALKADNLQDLVTNGSIAGAGFEPATFGL